MIYVVEIHKATETYTIFETTTESFIDIREAKLKELIIDPNITIQNMNIIGDQIITKQWYRICCRGHADNYKLTNTLLCKLDEQVLKLANSIAYETVTKSNEELKELIRDDRVGNCSIENEVYKSIGTYNAAYDTEFKEQIEEKYKIYVAKSALLGLNTTFEYIIEGQEVKLKSYTGTSKDVILPGFITSIMTRSFGHTHIRKLVLSEGLKSIGSFSFSACDIEELVIPSTVQIICNKAFNLNKGLSVGTIKILNTKTLILSDNDGGML